MAISGIETAAFGGAFSTLTTTLALPSATVPERPSAFDIVTSRQAVLSDSTNAFAIAAASDGSENASGLPTPIRLSVSTSLVQLNSGLIGPVLAAQGSSGPTVLSQTLSLFQSTAQLTAPSSTGAALDISA